MRIESLYLKNYRNVAEATCRFHPQFTVLAGRNGIGKSTWLHALRIASGCFFLGIPDVESRGIHENDIRVVSNGTFDAKQKPVVVEAKGSFYGLKEPITWKRRITEEGIRSTTSVSDVGNVRALAREKYKKIAAGEEVDLPVIAFFGPFRGGNTHLDRETKAMKGTFRMAYQYWYEMRSSVYGYQSWLDAYEVLLMSGSTYPHSKDAFFNAVEIANPFITQIGFIAGELWLEIKTPEYQSQYLPLRLHSDDVVTFTEMVAELAYRCIVLNGHHGMYAVENTAGLVMIDDLDLYLSPYWQRRVVQDLKKAFPGIQFVAGTHSSFIGENLDQAELIYLDYQKEAPSSLHLHSLL